MIGDPLTLAQMTQVVRNLATLRTPWVHEAGEFISQVVIYFFVDLCSWSSHGPSTLLLYIKFQSPPSHLVAASLMTATIMVISSCFPPA